jgi:hypothetical protein
MKHLQFYILILFSIVGVNAQTGIGTTTPASKLHVKSNGSIFRLEGTDHAYMEWYPQGTATRYGWIGYPSAGAIDLTFSSQFATGSLVLNTNNTERFRINSSGNVGIGTSNPTVSLQVAGDIIANSIAGSSDARFKSNIRPVENALSKVKSLRGVYFNWNQKGFPEKNFSDKAELGFIAQEVEKVLPEVVFKDNSTEEYRSVKYDKVVALLVEAIKEQQKQIDNLKNQVKKLSKKNK